MSTWLTAFGGYVAVLLGAGIGIALLKDILSGGVRDLPLFSDDDDDASDREQALRFAATFGERERVKVLRFPDRQAS